MIDFNKQWACLVVLMVDIPHTVCAAHCDPCLLWLLTKIFWKDPNSIFDFLSLEPPWALCFRLKILSFIKCLIFYIYIYIFLHCWFFASAFVQILTFVEGRKKLGWAVVTCWGLDTCYFFSLRPNVLMWT